MFFYPSCDSLITYFSVCNFQGGFDYKKAIVDTIIVIIEENSEAKEAGTIKVALLHVVLVCSLPVDACLFHFYELSSQSKRLSPSSAGFAVWDAWVYVAL